MAIKHILFITDDCSTDQWEEHTIVEGISCLSCHPNISPIPFQQLLTHIKKHTKLMKLPLIAIDLAISDKVVTLISQITKKLFCMPTLIAVHRINIQNQYHYFSINKTLSHPYRRIMSLLEYEKQHQNIDDTLVEICKKTERLSDRQSKFGIALCHYETYLKIIKSHINFTTITFCLNQSEVFEYLAYLIKHSNGWIHPLGWIKHNAHYILLFFSILCFIVTLCLSSLVGLQMSHTINHRTPLVLNSIEQRWFPIQWTKIQSRNNDKKIEQRWLTSVYYPLHALTMQYPINPNSQQLLSQQDYQSLFAHNNQVMRFLTHTKIHRTPALIDWLKWSHSYPNISNLTATISINNLAANIKKAVFRCHNQKLIYRHGPIASMKFKLYQPDGCHLTLTHFDNQQIYFNWKNPWVLYQFSQANNPIRNKLAQSISLDSRLIPDLSPLTHLSLPLHISKGEHHEKSYRQSH